MQKFTTISPYDQVISPFELFDKQWGLITAGTQYSHNTMTTAWGSLGIVWNVPTATVFVRPSRHTHQFLEREDHFSLSFFGIAEERQALRYLGSHSGRDGDKIEESGLTVQMFDGVPAFAEAKTVLVCKKAYQQPMAAEYAQQEFISEAHYPYDDGVLDGENFHHMFMGAIEKVYIKE